MLAFSKKKIGGLILFFLVLVVFVVLILRLNSATFSSEKGILQQNKPTAIVQTSSFARQDKENALAALRYGILNSTRGSNEGGNDEPMSDTEREMYGLANRYNHQLGETIVEMAPSVLEEMITEEIEDVNWRKQVEEMGKELLARPDFKETTMDEVLCGETICKVSLSSSNLKERTTFQDIGSSLGPWGEGHQVGGDFITDDGKYGTFIYFSKEGDFMPFLVMRERIAKKMGVAVVPR